MNTAYQYSTSHRSHSCPCTCRTCRSTSRTPGAPRTSADRGLHTNSCRTRNYSHPWQTFLLLALNQDTLCSDRWVCQSAGHLPELQHRGGGGGKKQQPSSSDISSQSPC